MVVLLVAEELTKHPVVEGTYMQAMKDNSRTRGESRSILAPEEEVCVQGPLSPMLDLVCSPLVTSKRTHTPSEVLPPTSPALPRVERARLPVRTLPLIKRRAFPVKHISE
jgi:hypothetical protein